MGTRWQGSRQEGRRDPSAGSALPRGCCGGGGAAPGLRRALQLPRGLAVGPPEGCRGSQPGRRLCVRTCPGGRRAGSLHTSDPQSEATHQAPGLTPPLLSATVVGLLPRPLPQAKRSTLLVSNGPSRRRLGYTGILFHRRGKGSGNAGSPRSPLVSGSAGLASGLPGSELPRLTPGSASAGGSWEAAPGRGQPWVGGRGGAGGVQWIIVPAHRPAFGVSPGTTGASFSSSVMFGAEHSLRCLSPQTLKSDIQLHFLCNSSLGKVISDP